MDRSARPYWDAISADFRISPPLAPADEDLAWLEAQASAQQRVAGEGRLRTLVLGITPGILTMPWPRPGSLVAIDWSRGILRHRWPDALRARHAVAVQGDWRALPFRQSSFDFIAGDGCYSALTSCDDVASLNDEVYRALAPGGTFCMRCFVLPERKLGPGEVFEALEAGHMEDPGLFRWLLVMAVHGDAQDGVPLRDVWAAWHARFPDPTVLCERFGWNQNDIRRIERWRGQPMRYSFHRLAQLYRLAEQRFAHVEHSVPGYAYGERFTRLVMRKS